jgi:hypothetical protein
MQSYPTVTLLLNNCDVPNQAILPTEEVVLSALTNPPFEELQAEGYELKFTVDSEEEATLAHRGHTQRVYKIKDEQGWGKTYRVRVSLCRSGFETSDEKTIYILRELNPRICFDDSVDDGNAMIVQEDRPLQVHAESIDPHLRELGLQPVWRGDGVRARHGALRADVDTSGIGERSVLFELQDRQGHPLYQGDRAIRRTARYFIEPRPLAKGDVVPVALQRSSVGWTSDKALWSWIRHSTRAIDSNQYIRFVDRVLCKGKGREDENAAIRVKVTEFASNISGANAYEVLKAATEVFLLTHCGAFAKGEHLRWDEREEAARLGETLTLSDLRGRIQDYLGANGRLPYLDRVITAAFPGLEAKGIFCSGLIASRIEAPCMIELIWNYWMEEGGLVQTMNAISRRFQNVRAPGQRDPLAHFELDPIRGLNPIIWGYIKDEWNRLSVRRRAYEYDHHYGLGLYGKAVGGLRPADHRSKFLEAFHNLLHTAFMFYKEDNDTTVIADGYATLNALKEVHLLLAQGAHNQFGEMGWTARTEMLIQQWILARPETRDFLQSRPMVPYLEPWMPQVDTMKTLQGWMDVTVTHFRDLAVFGEQILLSIRYGDWIGVNDENSAKNWARYWRPEIQSYLHAYRAVTGADLTNPDGVDYTPPAIHLRKRLALQRAR